MSKERYNRKIMEALHEVLDIEMNETIDDIRKLYSTTEILNAVLTYDGLMNYAYQIIGWIREIYGIDLEEVEDIALDALTSDEIKIVRRIIAEAEITGGEVLNNVKTSEDALEHHIETQNKSKKCGEEVFNYSQKGYARYLLTTGKARSIKVEGNSVLYEGKVFRHEKLLPFNGSRVDINGYPDSIMIMTKEGHLIIELLKDITGSEQT